MKSKSQARSGPRARQFSIVVHDVKPQAKAHFEKLLPPLMLDWSLVAEEPYNHQAGSHIHIFLKYPNPQAKFRILDYIQKQKQGGRVQVDIGRGAFQECKKYLTNPDKEKLVDNDINENTTNLTLTEKYPEQSDKCIKCNMLFFNPILPKFNLKFSDFCDDCEREKSQERIKEYLRRKVPEPDFFSQ